MNEESVRLYDLELWLKEKEDYKSQLKEKKLKESLKRKIKKIK